MAKILIVDDEPDICDLLDDLFSDWGFDVKTTTSGEDAINIMLREKPLFLLLDRRMPDLSGPGVLQKMKENNIKCHVVVMTADIDPQIHNELKSLGATGVITKPFEILKLRSQLASILPFIFKE